MAYVTCSSSKRQYRCGHPNTAAGGKVGGRVGAGASLKLINLKTMAIVFGGTRFINDFYSSATSRTIGLGDGASIPFSDTITSLGVVLDLKLSWQAHIDHGTKKFNRVMFALRFFRLYTTETLKIEGRNYRIKSTLDAH